MKLFFNLIDSLYLFIMSDSESMEVKIARIQERVTSDRKNHAINFKNINETLNHIVNKLEHKEEKEEKHRTQIALLIPQVEDSIKKSKENEKKLTDYKTKMKYWEIFHEWKHIPFWTFMALFVVVVRVQLTILINSLLDKFTGQ